MTDVNTTNIETKTIKIPTTDNTKHTTVTYENNNVKYTNSDGEIVYGITTSKDNPNKIDPKFLDFTCLKFGGTINPNKNYTIDIFDGNNLSTNILTYQNNVTYGSSILVNFDNTLGSSALNQQQIDSISGLYFLSSESGNLIYPSVVLSLTKNELLTKNQKWFKENFSICSEHTWNDIFGSDSDTATLISSTNINISLQEINDESSSLNTLDNTGSQTYKYIEFNQNVQTNIRMVSGKKISVSAMDIILFVNKTHNSTSVTTQQINENAGNNFEIISFNHPGSSSVSVSGIDNNSVTTEKLTNDSVTREKLNSNVAGSGLTQDTDGSLKISSGGVSATELQMILSREKN